MKKTQLAWAAGFFDGEGWITIRTNVVSGQIGVGQKMREPLFLLQEMFGIGSVGGPKPNGVSQWTVSGTAGAAVLEPMLPYLVVKRAQAEIFIAWAHAKWWEKSELAGQMRSLRLRTV